MKGGSVNRRDLDKVTFVPVELIRKACSSGMDRTLLELIRIKLQFGACVPKGAVKGGWKRLVGAGWARASERFIHPLPWRELALWRDYSAGKSTIRKLIQGGQAARFTLHMTGHGPAAFFHILQEYALRIHRREGMGGTSSSGEGIPTRAEPEAREPRRKAGKLAQALLRQSPHEGGISLSLMAGMFNRTKAWASGMRRVIQSLGWCLYTRRWIPVTRNELVVAKRCKVTAPYVYRKSTLKDGSLRYGPAMEVTSACIPLSPVTLRFRVFSTITVSR